VERGSESGGNWVRNGGKRVGKWWKLDQQVVEIGSAVVEIGSPNAEKEILMLKNGFHNGENLYTKKFEFIPVPC
jgi:hypothetical protein